MIVGGRSILCTRLQQMHLSAGYYTQNMASQRTGGRTPIEFRPGLFNNQYVSLLSELLRRDVLFFFNFLIWALEVRGEKAYS